MYPVFARITWVDFENKITTSDVWFFAIDFGQAARKIEEQFGDELMGFSIYLFESNAFLYEEDRTEMEKEAKTALGLQ